MNDLKHKIKLVKRIEAKLSRAGGLFYEAELMVSLNGLDLGAGDTLKDVHGAQIRLLRLVETRRREMQQEVGK